MDMQKAGLVICLTVFIVIGVNAAILAGLRRYNQIGQIELLKRAANRSRAPWQSEDADLAELNKIVKQLKDEHEHKSPPDRS